MIEQSSEPNELVVDTFLGSGSVGEAALSTKRRFAGCDIANSAVELSRKRLTGYPSATEVSLHELLSVKDNCSIKKCPPQFALQLA